MAAQRPLPAELARAHSNSAPPAMSTANHSASDDWHSDSAQDEDETCRICKSEATPDQPLFYPCKCSGSIKYVHQDCLMEWLERSQKKHCELCKTPFRFTKLYERDMPAQLPLPIFAKHMVLHMAGTLRLWARGLFVGAVWLVALPWVMRHIWAVLFYLADGGWWVHSRSEPHPILGAAIHETRMGYELYGTCILSPLFPERSTNAKITKPMNALWKFFVDQANNNATFANLSYKDVMRAMFYPAAFDSYGLPPSSRNLTSPTITYNMDASAASFAKKPEMILRSTNDSILSRFNFIQNMTKSPSLNRQIITILEGQIITVVVVVCFILIFLIREWVVQQQPGINVGDGFNAQFPNAARDAEVEQERIRRVREDGARELQRLILNMENANGEGHGQGGRGAANAVERDEDEEERIDAEWGEIEEVQMENGIQFIRRRVPRLDHHSRGGHLARVQAGVDQNGNLMPTIGTTNFATTEDTLRDIPEEDKIKFVRRKLLKHVRVVVPSMAEKVTDLMMQEGIDSVLSYIDYEDDIGDQVIYALLEYNRKLIEDGKDAILSKEEGKNDALKDVLNYKAGFYFCDPDRVIKVFFGLPLEVILDDLPHPDRLHDLITDLHYTVDRADTVLQQPELGALKWRRMVLGLQEESEDSDESKFAHYADVSEEESQRALDYVKDVRKTRMARDGEVNNEGEGDDEIAAPKGDGGVSPERVRYMAKLAAKGNGEAKSETAEPFKFNFTNEELDLEEAPLSDVDEQENSLPTPPSTVGPSETPRFRNRLEELQAALTEGLQNEPQPEGGEVSAEDATHGIVGYTPSGSPIYSNAEIMRRIGAGEVDEGWTSDNEPTAYTQDDDSTQQPTPDDSGIDTELRTPAELADNVRLEAEAEAARIEAARPKTLAGRLALWLWGDVEDEAADEGVDDEHVVDDIDAEAPFVAVNHGHHEHHHDHGHDDDDDHDEPAPPVDAAVVNAGFADDLGDMDVEAIDEAEDFDGIMELVGMRGSIIGLVQNALIGIILLAITVFIGVWIPYIVGKVTLLLSANPVQTVKAPLRLVFKIASVVQDVALVAFGGCYYTFIKGISLIFRLFGKDGRFLAEKNGGIAGLGAMDAVMYAGSALERVVADLVLAFSPDSEIPYFSAAAHESLNSLRTLVARMFDFASISRLFSVTTSETGTAIAPLVDLWTIKDLALNFGISSLKFLIKVPSLLAKPESWVITLSSPSRQHALDMALSHWSPIDRSYAILAGYSTFIFLGCAYIRKGSPFSTSATGREWEALFIDMLNQAGGVLKVILIISIEMLVFPLYCGLLLDVATLPLFEGATLWGRLANGWENPCTSAFVHWFVGTCYMFHFALFVSMCRKILRKGTLYFIRDPDDPTFHPVRDVLERNVATQLRKISFSAAVYGALVLVCLGGVVWSLAFVFQGVLPIRWSSNEPVLEFPIDLLFYNFLMPLAVNYIKPSEGLHALYKWWFNQSAHYLRLSHFLLGERRMDEELWAAPGTHGSPSQLSAERQKEIIEFQAVSPPAITDPPTITTKAINPEASFDKAYVNRGRYVRAPASDMVRIPKHTSVFLPVNSKNERLDGEPEPKDAAHILHAKTNTQFQMVYHPPHFRYRIGLFIFALWMFAAVTGCSATLLPLVLGRRIFAKVLPEEVERNDVYAFAMGLNLMGSILYAIYHLRTSLARAWRTITASNPVSVISTAATSALKIAKLAFTYTTLLLLCPALMAGLIESYLILPLHTLINKSETHTVHIVQSWTLGLLVCNLARRWLLSPAWGLSESRAARALRRVVRRGYADLDVALAIKGFIAPFVVISVAALIIPAVGAGLAVRLGAVEPSVRLYRNAYPAFMAVVMAVVGVVVAIRKLGEWRLRVRDEVYLIGERLHNFQEKGKGKAVRRVGLVGRIET